MPSPQDPATAADPPPRGFRHVRDETIVEDWRISLVRASFEAPDGTTFTRAVVRHPGAVAVVPVTTAGTALLVRQYRGPLDRVVLEIPAGVRDVAGEPPELTARRELEEEVGVRAGTMELLTTVLNTPGFCDEVTLLYLARDLRPGQSARQGEEEAAMEVVEVALDDVDAMITTGELADAQSLVGLLLARDRWRAGPGAAPDATADEA